ncbi:MAG: hypothetical protein ACI9V8_002156, partial [Urechidicola sp.]
SLLDNGPYVILISCIPVTMHCSTFGAPNRYIHAVVLKRHFGQIS